MKTIIVFVLVFVAIPEIFGAKLYDEKENAKNEIKNKFEETENYLKWTLNKILDEKEKNDEVHKNPVIECDTTKKKKTVEELSKNALETAKTAIAKGKPLTAIECIGKTDLEGQKLIDDLQKNNLKDVENIRNNRVQNLEFAEYEVNLIGKAMKGLKDDSLKKIDEVKTVVEDLKKDALKKLDLAKKHIAEVENQIYKSNIPEEYQKLKLQIEKKYDEIQQALYKRLQKCVA